MGLAEVFPLRDSKGDLWQRAAKVNRRRPSEGQLADLFVERHCREVRFVRTRPACWIAWNGEKWTCNDIHALRLVCGICREASEDSGYPAIDSNRTVNAVLALAKFDPRILVSKWPCHPDLEAAVDAWIADRCVLDPKAWTSRPAMLASTRFLLRDIGPQAARAALFAAATSMEGLIRADNAETGWLQ
jgi:hypothetical protein